MTEEQLYYPHRRRFWTVPRIILFIVVLLCVSLFTVAVVAKPFIQQKVEDMLAARNINAEQIDVSYTGSVTLTNLSVQLDNGMSVRSRNATVRPPLAVLAGSVDARDITVSLPDGSMIQMPHLQLSGLHDDKDAAAEKSLPSSLARLKFSNLTIDQINFTGTRDGSLANASIEQFNLNNYQNGHIGQIGFNHALAQISQLAGFAATQTQAGQFSAADIDLDALFRLYKNNEAANTQLQLAGSVDLRDFNIAQNGDQQTQLLNIGEISSNGLTVNHPGQSFENIVKSILETQESGANQHQMMRDQLVQLMRTLQQADIHFSNISLSMPENQLSSDISAMDFTKNNDLLTISLNGVNTRSGSGHIRTQNAEIAGISVVEILNFIERMQALRDNSDNMQNLMTLDFSDAVPRIQHILVNGVDVEYSSSDSQQKALSVSLESFELRPEQWDQAIPKALHLRLSNLSFPVDNIRPEVAKMLQQLQLDQVQLSGGIELVWDEATRSFNLTDMSFGGANVGYGKLTGTLVNVDPALFTGNTILMGTAVAGIRFTDLDMSYQDEGLLERVIIWVHSITGGSLDDVRTDMITLIEKTPLSLLSGRPEAEAVSQAFGSFARNPNHLNIHIRPRDPQGLAFLTVFDALRQEDGLRDLLTLLDFSAVAN